MSEPSPVAAFHRPPRTLSDRLTAGRAEVQLYGVYEISKLLGSAAPLEVTLHQVLQVLASFLDLRHGLIALTDERGEPGLVVDSSAGPATAQRYFAQLPQLAIHRLLATDTPIVVTSVRSDPSWRGWAAATTADAGDLSFLAVPIHEESAVTGMLAIDRPAHADEPASVGQDLLFLNMLASLLGQAVRVRRLASRERERHLEERRRLEREVEASTSRSREDFGGIVGDSAPLKAVIEKVRVVARSNSTVLLRGESGTGKELFARAIHDLSPRRGQSFIKLNCAALPESVLESELFGHEKGAFTGAVALRKGRFELAHGGTLFLDEIGEISGSFQAKLLRVLQEGEFERVGGTKTLKVDVRLVAATHRNLEEAVARGEFRADLYYRLGVIPIALPALRDRATDIPLLAREFLQRFNREHGGELQFAEDGMEVLSECLFPGNVRELENCVRRTATLASGNVIRAEDFACRKRECLSAALWQPANGPQSSSPGFVPLPLARGPRATVPPSAADPTDAEAGPPVDAADLHGVDERQQLLQAMESAGWVQAKAARILGLTPRQVGYALRKHDIAIKKF